MNAASPARLRRKAGPAGTRCRNCDLVIEKFRSPGLHDKLAFDTWIHSGTSNVWCQAEFVGTTAKFADPS